MRRRRLSPRMEALEERRLLTLVVTSTADTVDPTDGVLTLREAIEQANTIPGPDTIAFALPPDDPGHVYYRDDGIAGKVTATNVAPTTAADDATIADIDPDWPHSWWTIRPRQSPRVITDTVTLDGFTQAGAWPNSNPIEEGSNAVLKIALDGSGVENDSDVNGLTFAAPDCTVRGLVISSFPGIGIVGSAQFFPTAGQCERARIEGNYIGTDPSGTLPRGNSAGILLGLFGDDSFSTIGGRLPAARNLISGNSGLGIDLFTREATIQGNYIGTNASGRRALSDEPLGQQGVGIRVVWVRNTIGGSALGEANVIAGNSGDGILILEGSKDNVISGNAIGADGRREGAIGNGGSGVSIWHRPSFSGGPAPSWIETSGNQISENTIAYNATGIAITDSAASPAGARVLRHLITSNAIYSNRGLGIDLGEKTHSRPDGYSIIAPDGPTPNDVGDADSGPNGFQNFPTLTTIRRGTSSTTVLGSLHSRPDARYTIEFFSNDADDPSGHGEGQYYLGSIVTDPTDANGDVRFRATLPVVVRLDQSITTTATDPEGNTSEFSFAFGRGADTTADLVTTITASPSLALAGEAVTYTITLANRGPDAATGVVLRTTTLPPDVVFGSTSHGVFDAASGTVVCDLGTIAVGGTVVVTVVVQPATASVARSFALGASVSADQDDPGATVRAMRAEATLVLPPGAVRSTGPVVRSVVRRGVRRRPTRLVVTLDRDLDTATAMRRRNYRLIAPGADGWLGTRDDRRIRIRSVVYNPATRSILLRPVERLKLWRNYRLRLDGHSAAGLSDTLGGLLDGDRDGRAGGDFSVRVTRSMLVGGPRKISRQDAKIAKTDAKKD